MITLGPVRHPKLFLFTLSTFALALAPGPCWLPFTGGQPVGAQLKKPVSPIKEPGSPTTIDGGIKLQSIRDYLYHRQKSVAFSNGLNIKRSSNPRDAYHEKPETTRSVLGIVVRAMTGKDKRHYGLKKSGAVLIWVDPLGPFGRAGFEINDVILEINNRPVSNAQDILNALRSTITRGDLLVHGLDHRTGRTGFVQVPIP